MPHQARRHFLLKMKFTRSTCSPVRYNAFHLRIPPHSLLGLFPSPAHLPVILRHSPAGNNPVGPASNPAQPRPISPPMCCSWTHPNIRAPGAAALSLLVALARDLSCSCACPAGTNLRKYLAESAVFSSR